MIFNPEGCLIVASSHVQPSNAMTEDWPDILPDAGVELTTSIPFDLVTGIKSESGLYATLARTLGLISPTSEWSLVCLTADISVSPILVYPAIYPGTTCFP